MHTEVEEDLSINQVISVLIKNQLIKVTKLQVQLPTKTPLSKSKIIIT